jgi:hypothetical protein
VETVTALDISLRVDRHRQLAAVRQQASLGYQQFHLVLNCHLILAMELARDIHRILDKYRLI